MRGNRLSIVVTVAVAIFTVSLFMTSTLAAAQEQVLHSFNNNGTDGVDPNGGVIFDAAGNLYGTTWRAAPTATGHGVRVDAGSGRGLDGAGAAQLRQAARTGLIPPPA